MRQYTLVLDEYIVKYLYLVLILNLTLSSKTLNSIIKGLSFLVLLILVSITFTLNS